MLKKTQKALAALTIATATACSTSVLAAQQETKQPDDARLPITSNLKLIWDKDIVAPYSHVVKGCSSDGVPFIARLTYIADQDDITQAYQATKDDPNRPDKFLKKMDDATKNIVADFMQASFDIEFKDLKTPKKRARFLENVAQNSQGKLPLKASLNIHSVQKLGNGYGCQVLGLRSA